MAITDLNSLSAQMLKDMASVLKDYQPRPEIFAPPIMRGELERLFKSRPDQITEYTSTYGTVPVHFAPIPPKEVLDWSGCRSPSRAKRRHARGYPQRVKTTYGVAFLILLSVRRLG